MVRLLARVMGVGIETADMLVQEVLARNLRDQRAVARYAGLTGSPDESGKKRARRAGQFRQPSGSAGHDPIGVAISHVPEGSALPQWSRARPENARGSRKTMVVALARKLLIALWRLVRVGVVPDGRRSAPGRMIRVAMPVTGDLIACLRPAADRWWPGPAAAAASIR